MPRRRDVAAQGCIVPAVGAQAGDANKRPRREQPTTACARPVRAGGTQTVCMRSAISAAGEVAMLATRMLPSDASRELAQGRGSNSRGMRSASWATSLSAAAAGAAAMTASAAAADGEVAPTISGSVPAEPDMLANAEMRRIRQILLQPSPVVSPAPSPAAAQGGVRPPCLLKASPTSLAPCIAPRTSGAASADALVAFDLPPPAAEHGAGFMAAGMAGFASLHRPVSTFQSA